MPTYLAALFVPFLDVGDTQLGLAAHVLALVHVLLRALLPLLPFVSSVTHGGGGSAAWSEVRIQRKS